jgi:hypothetical protein
MMNIVDELRLQEVADDEASIKTCRLLREAADEIERLQDAKRRALAIADERSRENVQLRRQIEQLMALGAAGAYH